MRREAVRELLSRDNRDSWDRDEVWILIAAGMKGEGQTLLCLSGDPTPSDMQTSQRERERERE